VDTKLIHVLPTKVTTVLAWENRQAKMETADHLELSVTKLLTQMA
jgi:hypothetical protein